MTFLERVGRNVEGGTEVPECRNIRVTLYSPEFTTMASGCVGPRNFHARNFWIPRNADNERIPRRIASYLRNVQPLTVWI